MSNNLIDDFNVDYTNNNDYDLGPWETSIPKIGQRIKT